MRAPAPPSAVLSLADPSDQIVTSVGRVSLPFTRCNTTPRLPLTLPDPASALRRFLRKPNVSEAAEEFGRLAGRLAQSELPEYAGLTQLARAKCLETLGTKTAETDALIAAARQFITVRSDGRVRIHDSRWTRFSSAGFVGRLLLFSLCFDGNDFSYVAAFL